MQETAAHTAAEALDLTVVVPVYNSVDTLEQLYLRLQAGIRALGKSFEVIFVLDGGETASWEALKAIKAAHAETVTVIRLARNFGQHNATLCGIEHARGAMILTIDDDLQTPPEELGALYEAFENGTVDVVYGIYKQKKHSILRNIGSKLLKSVFRYFTSGLRDASSFRLFTADIGRKLGQHNHHFVFLDQIIAWHTLDIAFVQVEHQKRQNGKSGYTGRKLFSMAFNFLFAYTDIPLKMITWTGLIASILSFFLGTFFIIQKLVVGAEVGFTALFSMIAFSASVILFSLGILGEYIGRLFSVHTERPKYSIKQKL